MNELDTAMWLRDHPVVLSALWVAGLSWIAAPYPICRFLGAMAATYPGLLAFRILMSAP